LNIFVSFLSFNEEEGYEDQSFSASKPEEQVHGYNNDESAAAPSNQMAGTKRSYEDANNEESLVNPNYNASPGPPKRIFRGRGPMGSTGFRGGEVRGWGGYGRPRGSGFGLGGGDGFRGGRGYAPASYGGRGMGMGSPAGRIPRFPGSRGGWSPRGDRGGGGYVTRRPRRGWSPRSNYPY